MREISYRARRTDNGEWVEGNLVWIKNCNNEPYQCFIISHLAYMEYGEFDDTYQVLPETVGQHTGRNVGADKLFEGDIIEWVEDYDDNWGDSKSYIGRSIVIWDNDNSCWAVKTDTYIQFFNDFSWDRCYVIGNIHDNPELLEVK